MALVGLITRNNGDGGSSRLLIDNREAVAPNSASSPWVRLSVG